MTSYQLQNV